MNKSKKTFYKVRFFNKTKLVLPELHNMEEGEEEEETLFVCRPEEYYALSSQRLKDRKVIVVTPDIFRRGLEIEQE